MTEMKNPGIDMNIVFIYFNDLAKAMNFYEDVLGFTLAIDQGWTKIYQSSTSGYIGLVDGTRGYHKASEVKPLILCFRVPDVDAWYQYLLSQGVPMLKDIKNSEELHIRAFLIEDPEGHTLEFQSVI
jgi:lactoylglutathione lyase